MYVKHLAYFINSIIQDSEERRERQEIETIELLALLDEQHKKIRKRSDESFQK